MFRFPFSAHDGAIAGSQNGNCGGIDRVLELGKCQTFYILTLSKICKADTKFSTVIDEMERGPTRLSLSLEVCLFRVATK